MPDAKASDLTGDNRRIWEENPPTFVERRAETILELLPRLGPEASLLDVGCIRGSYTPIYAGELGAGSVCGVDVCFTQECMVVKVTRGE